jgi:hypothetical protein
MFPKSGNRLSDKIILKSEIWTVSVLRQLLFVRA